MASVYEEIERISKAKEDIEDAIESCGVTVPDTELIDKYANYIRSIPNNIFSNLNVDTIGGGDTFIRSIEQINGKINANIGGIVSNTESGIVPKIDNSNNSSITDQAEEWVLTSDKGATPTWKRLPVNAFLNENDDTTYTLSGSLDNNNYNITLTSSNGSTSGAEISCMSAASSNNAGTAGLVPAPTKGKQTSFLRGDGTWAIPTNTTYDAMTLNEAKTGTAIIARTITAKVLHDKISTMIPTSMDWSNITNKPLSYNPLAHNHNSEEIISLTNYIKATENASLSNTDTLNSALGKLEYKADLGTTAYALINAANDKDGTIENLKEILDVLEGIKDTDTIQAIVNKYLPLSGGTMSGNINFDSDKGIYVNNSYAILALGSKGKFTGHPNDEESYTFVGTTNYNTIIRTKNKLQVYKNSNRYNIIDSSGGTISGSLTWEIPDYSVIPIIRNIKFTETTGWARKILAMQVDGVEQFSLGAYGYYNFPLNSENPNKADYLYLGFNSWDGNNLRVYPDGITFGNETIWHSGNCNFLSSTNKNLTPAGSEITNVKIGELIGYQAINKSSWVYANNGYIKTEWGKMELAGSSILSFGTSSAYTQLFISAPSSSRGDGLTNEMMFYNNHGSTYSPGWTRVVTNRNYTKVIGNPFKVNAQSYNTNSDGSVSTGDIYLEMWRGTSASWKLVNNSGTFRFQCNYTDTAASYYDALTITYNSGNIWTKGGINIAKTDSYANESVLPTYAKLIIGAAANGTYGLYLSRNSIQHMSYDKLVDNALLINPLGGNVKIGNTNSTSSLLQICNYKNTTTIGSQNASYCHIYNSADIPFIFNKSVLTISGSLGSTSYRWDTVYAKTGNFSATTGTSPFTVSSTTVVSNLNADLLDGVHKGGLLTALTSSADTNLSITVGGTTKSVTNLLARHISPIKDLNTNVTTKTVASVKTEIVNAFSNISYGIGSNITVPAVAIANWDTDTTQLTASSVYSMIKIGGGYSGTQYG